MEARYLQLINIHLPIKASVARLVLRETHWLRLDMDPWLPLKI
jgi:hypothetical protein